MNLEEKLRQLNHAAQKSSRDIELERQLEYLRRKDQSARSLPAQRVPKGIEGYVQGQPIRNAWGEFFSARQALPFGRPYGKLRIADLSASNLRPLDLFLENATLPEPAEIVYLDTETTGLVGGTGTCAFLIGLGFVSGSEFVVQQFFLRDHPEEKAMLAALSEVLATYKAVATFNGKTFDVPLLETRYSLARLKSPFERLLHLDLLHPARRLWKLRLESCQLTHLEAEVLGINRQGDVDGSEIPPIYFDYLRTGNARGLQPVFYHNSLDIVTLAALTVELARVVALYHMTPGEAEGEALGVAPVSREHSLDLFSLSRIFERAGVRDQSVATCQRALDLGLPEAVEARALLHLATQHKRQKEYDRAVTLWMELSRRQEELAFEAMEELAMYHEHRRRDARTALEFVEAALGRMDQAASPEPYQRFTYRLERLRRKAALMKVVAE